MGDFYYIKINIIVCKLLDYLIMGLSSKVCKIYRGCVSDVKSCSRQQELLDEIIKF